MTIKRLPARGEDGAVAIMVGVLAVVLMAVAAMTVDLGNAWARAQSVQKQVDVSALSVGHLLPAATPADQLVVAKAVAAYLKRENNKTWGQANIGLLTGAQLLNGDPSDGEVVFTENGERLEVTAPKADVGFAFAGVMGIPGVKVHATATVRVESQIPGSNVLPFAIPSGCPFGPGKADTESPGKTVKATPPGDFTPSNGDTGSHTISTLTPNTTAPTLSVPVVATLGNLPNNSTGGNIRFRIGATNLVDIPVTWPQTSNSDRIRTVNFTVTTDVTGTSGTWKVWLLLNKYSESSQTFTVTGEPPPDPLPVGCANKMQGNFGKLDSPRNDEHKQPEAYALNIAKGLDHLVVPFRSPSSEDCGKNSPIPDAVLDVAPIPPPDQPQPNCLHVEPGNAGPNTMDGLVTGVNSVKGRLDAQNGNTKAGCGSNATINGVTVNNDKLSCFLRNGATLAQLASPAGVTSDMLDPAAVKSPRFVWIPVFHSLTRQGHEFQPILKFVPAFITDETQTTAATSDNGVIWSGNSVSSIQVFTFNPAALPIDERDPSIPYDPNLTRVVRLIG